MRKTKQIFVIVVALGFILFPISVIAGQKLNINTATIEQLQNLPGVGSHIAQEIINYRHEHGPFQKVPSGFACGYGTIRVLEHPFASGMSIG